MAAPWRLIRSGFLPGALNMALDEALLEEVTAGRSAPVLRLYRWSPPALTLGYAQPAAEVDLAACREFGLDLVRRPTGGRAVLHDREATYAVIAPDHLPAFAGRILDTYCAIAQALRGALHTLGLPAELAPGRRDGAGEGSGICFTAPSSWELVCQGCKVAGSAQKRVAGAFLQHGSIPLEMDLHQLCRVLGPRARGAAPTPERLARKVGWLNRWLAVPATVESVESALIAAFETELGVQLLEQETTAAERDRARSLAARKYANPEWTFDPERHSI